MIDFREPKREYKAVKLGRWTIEVDQQLIKEAPEIATKATKRLRENIDEVFRLIPKASHPKLKQLRFFLLYGPKSRGGGRNNGLEYFSPEAPKYYPLLDERWKSTIIVYSAENYTQISDLWALKALIHEFGHAYHLENWQEKQPHIMEAWQNAVDSKLYLDVKEEKGIIIPEAYAHTNQLEYFAELTAMYFAKCNYEPVDRAALKKYDPMGYEMIRKMWGLSKDDPTPPVDREVKKSDDAKKSDAAKKGD